ncbi:hypothetical protein MLD38_010984 [Melastoma candidum]|uniref:Uncharacterized protein n=1 Tax=Melastoma candidum TaxID=119954 RepID=A0ACB9R1L1_9MYRT|nr:hypothetical protein MLD38_010984 [Melastoma candidum]
MARTMICESNAPQNLWAEAVNTACYISNRVLFTPILEKTPYQLYRGRKPNISYFHAFGSPCFILRPSKDNLGKFEAEIDEGIFLGYSLSSKAYRVLSKRTSTIEESINVKINDSPFIDTTGNVISLEPTEGSLEHSPSTKEVGEPSVHESKDDSEQTNNNSEESSQNNQNDFRAPVLYKKRHPID